MFIWNNRIGSGNRKNRAETIRRSLRRVEEKLPESTSQEQARLARIEMKDDHEDELARVD